MKEHKKYKTKQSTNKIYDGKIKPHVCRFEEESRIKKNKVYLPCSDELF